MFHILTWQMLQILMRMYNAANWGAASRGIERAHFRGIVSPNSTFGRIRGLFVFQKIETFPSLAIMQIGDYRELSGKDRHNRNPAKLPSGRPVGHFFSSKFNVSSG